MDFLSLYLNLIAFNNIFFILLIQKYIFEQNYVIIKKKLKIYLHYTRKKRFIKLLIKKKYEISKINKYLFEYILNLDKIKNI